MPRTSLALLLCTCLSLPALAASSYTVDSSQTFPSIEITQLGMAIPLGRFNSTTGTMLLDEKAASGSIQLAIETASISTGLASLEAHLRSPALLDAEHFPRITFVSDKLRFNNEQLVAVEGLLTLHGITKPVHVTVQRFHCSLNPDTLKNICDAKASMAIKRSDFGVAKYVPVISDRANIAMQLFAIQD
ncbi:MAG: YceI family protein [Methylococcales bacterium]|nr:YceI family protein [Methylococcales bacterium]